MKEPVIFTDGGAMPMSKAPNDCLARLASSPDWTFHRLPGEPPESASICRSIATHLLQERAH